MRGIIHRKGCGRSARYRVWGTICDQYLTSPLTRAQLLAMLLRDEGPRDAEERVARADANGTSSVAYGPRDTATWDTERCNHCATFHHAYEARTPDDGTCSACGELPADVSHKPPCKARTKRTPR